MLGAFAAPPNFPAPRELMMMGPENLVFSASVRGSADSPFVCANVPRSAAKGQLLADYTIPVDVLMDDYCARWLRPYRLVVTAVRESDGKMCQLIDVQGTMTEHGQDTNNGEGLFTIVPRDTSAGVGGLHVSCWLGLKPHRNGRFPRRSAQAPPEPEKTVEKTGFAPWGGAWQTYNEGTFGLLTRLCFKYNGHGEEFNWLWDKHDSAAGRSNLHGGPEPPKPFSGSRFGDEEEEVDLGEVAAMLAKLEWH